MKYALVTGASRGLGRAIALKIASMNIPVIINYQNNEEAAQQTLDDIVKNGGNAELMRFNVAVKFVRNICTVQNIENLFRNSEFHKVGVGTDKGFLKTSSADFGSDFFNRALAVVTCFVKNKPVHFLLLFFR